MSPARLRAPKRPAASRLRTSTALCALGAVLAAPGVTACSTSDEPSCGDPAYDGSASDEAWLTMIDGEAIVKLGDARAPVIESPAEGATLSLSGPPIELRWTSSLSAALSPRRSPRTPAERVEAGTLTRLTRAASGLFVSTAFAHLPPVTGDIYDLKLSIPGRTCPIEILTTELDYPLSASQWAALGASGAGTITLEITSAFLRENRITEGPYRPAPRTFQVAP